MPSATFFSTPGMRVSPRGGFGWTVGYESVSATVSSMVSGILVILFGAWELMTDRDFITWWHDRWHHPAT
jgi:hypothetical protein